MLPAWRPGVDAFFWNVLQDSNMEGLPAVSSAVLVMPESDEQGLSAYLRLFTRVFEEGDDSDIVAWMHVLEEEMGAVPLWEILFQLMCLQVPQVLCSNHASLSIIDIPVFKDSIDLLTFISTSKLAWSDNPRQEIGNGAENPSPAPDLYFGSHASKISVDFCGCSGIDHVSGIHSRE
jgi:hypothetical protein